MSSSFSPARVGACLAVLAGAIFMRLGSPFEPVVWQNVSYCKLCSCLYSSLRRCLVPGIAGRRS